MPQQKFSKFLLWLVSGFRFRLATSYIEFSRRFIVNGPSLLVEMYSAVALRESQPSLCIEPSPSVNPNIGEEHETSTNARNCHDRSVRGYGCLGPTRAWTFRPTWKPAPPTFRSLLTVFPRRIIWWGFSRALPDRSFASPNLTHARTSSLFALHASKAQVICSGCDFPLPACAHDVARAVLIGAEEGPTAMDFLRLIRFVGIVRGGGS